MTATPMYEPTMDLVEITPATAQAWLEKFNTHNRNIRLDFVGFLADQIRAGQWMLDGNPIRFSRPGVYFQDEFCENGCILDGQHRLMAIAEAGIPVPSYVARNLEPETQMVMDSGPRRSLGDQLKLNHEKNTQQLAATITRLYLTRIGENALRNPSRFRPPVPAALIMLDKEPTIRDAVREGARTANKLGGTSVAVLATCYYIFHQISADQADEFFESLRDGENLSSGDPVLMLRNRLISNSRQRGETPPRIVQAWIIKAWNAFREDLPMAQVSWRSIGTNPEPFPTPI